MSSIRQLAAIMYTNIVGYTALMGVDEEKAFEYLELAFEQHTAHLLV
jgi:class 3 adenylate cyclase